MVDVSIPSFVFLFFFKSSSLCRSLALHWLAWHVRKGELYHNADFFNHCCYRAYTPPAGVGDAVMTMKDDKCSNGPCDDDVIRIRSGGEPEPVSVICNSIHPYSIGSLFKYAFFFVCSFATCYL